MRLHDPISLGISNLQVFFKLSTYRHVEIKIVILQDKKFVILFCIRL